MSQIKEQSADYQLTDLAPVLKVVDAGNILLESLPVWLSAQTRKSAGRGRSAENTLQYGVQKLRELILELAVRGKLVSQDPNDEPASLLLKKIAEEKSRLVKEGKIKKQKILPPVSIQELLFQAPAGWGWTRLGVLFNSIISGGTPSKNNPAFWGGDIPWASVKDLGKARYIRSTQDFITEEGLKKGSKLADVGDILICTRMGLGKTAICESPIAINQDLKAIKMSSHVSVDFFLNAYTTIDIKGTGTTVAGITQDKLLNYPIALPPLAEQQRIVKKVDELMALCDQLEQQQADAVQAHDILVKVLLDALTQSENAEGFQQNWHRIAEHFDTLFTTESSIDQLKQTLLQLAVMGKLVPQDPNDEPANILLEKIAVEKARLVKEGKIKEQKSLPEIREIETPFALPAGWKWAHVEDVAQLITSGSRGWAKYYSNEGAIFITMGNLSRGHYHLRMDDIRYVNPPKSGEGARTKLVENDLLISITGDVGNLGLVPENFGDAYINQHTCLLRFMPECQNRYFPELMRSPLANIQFNAPQRGVKNSFRLSDVGEMIIPIPPLAEQPRIVKKVDELMVLCDQLKDRLNQAQTLQQQLANAVVEKTI